MRCFHVEARDIPDAWFQLVDLCYSQGRDYLVGEGSYAGSQKRRELDYVTVHIRFPATRPLLPEVPPGLGIPNPVPEGMDYVERYLPYLMTTERQPGEQYTYGERLFSERSRATTAEERTADPFVAALGDAGRKIMPSQVDEVVAKFRRGFANNQATMAIAQPDDIHLSDPPCLRQIDCRIYEDGDDARQLHFVVYFRSWDLWGGFLANLAAIVHLQEFMAEMIGVGVGEMVCASKGLHLYDMYWGLARTRLGEK